MPKPSPHAPTSARRTSGRHSSGSFKRRLRASEGVIAFSRNRAACRPIGLKPRRASFPARWFLLSAHDRERKRGTDQRQGRAAPQAVSGAGNETPAGVHVALRVRTDETRERNVRQAIVERLLQFAPAVGRRCAFDAPRFGNCRARVFDTAVDDRLRPSVRDDHRGRRGRARVSSRWRGRYRRWLRKARVARDRCKQREQHEEDVFHATACAFWTSHA